MLYITHKVAVARQKAVEEYRRDHPDIDEKSLAVELPKAPTARMPVAGPAYLVPGLPFAGHPAVLPGVPPRPYYFPVMEGQRVMAMAPPAMPPPLQPPPLPPFRAMPLQYAALVETEAQRNRRLHEMRDRMLALHGMHAHYQPPRNVGRPQR